MPPATPPPADSQRLDTWLWAARFFKTRTLAQTAIEGGKVHVNGHAAKPARLVRPGDQLDLTLGEARWHIVIEALNAQRRPAPEARTLYRETPESAARREAEQEARRLAPSPGSDARGRPTKRDRRQITRFGG